VTEDVSAGLFTLMVRLVGAQIICLQAVPRKTMINYAVCFMVLLTGSKFLMYFQASHAQF
jgi:hypothetical protein